MFSVGRWLPTASIITGFFLSAIIGFFVKDYLSQAKVNVQIISMGLGKEGALSVLHETPRDLTKIADQLPYEFPEFGERLYINQVNDTIFLASRFIEANAEASKIINEMIDILNNRARDINGDRLRRELALKFGEGPGNIIENNIKAAIEETGFLHNIFQAYEKVKRAREEGINTERAVEELAKYAVHPDDFRDDPLKNRISSSNLFWLNLSEESQDSISAFQTNIFRRLFIYLDREIFVERLIEAKNIINSNTLSLRAFDERMRNWLEEINPDKLFARLQVANSGEQSATISLPSALAYAIGGKYVAESATMSIVGGEERVPSILLQGDSSILIDLYSRKPLRELNLQPATGTGDLRTIFLSNVVSGQVALRVHFDNEVKIVVPKNKLTFGGSSIDDHFFQMEKTLTEQKPS